MKSLKFTVYFATVFVVLYTLMARMSIPFGVIYATFLVAQGLLFFMVYRILKDRFTTSRTFNDWYQDKDIKRN